MDKKASLWLFLIGLGSVTQFHFFGSLGLSELPIFLLAPVIFIVDYNKLKHDGFLPVVWLSLLCCLGCFISVYFNKTPEAFILKGFAQPYSFFASIIVLHHFLRQKLSSFKWFFLGVYISGIISVFIFQQETFTFSHGDMASGEEAIRRVITYPLFWSGKFFETVMLPVVMAYLSVPLSYSVLMAGFSMVVFFLFSGSSGRAAALIAFISAMLFFFGGKGRKGLLRMERHIGLLILAGILGLFIFKTGYSLAAEGGYLGYEIQQKYFSQTKGGTDLLKIIMAGRMEFFCGAMACLDKPIIGYGPKGEDTGGYVEKYLRDYATQEDYAHYLDTIYRDTAKYGYVYRTIPAHSYVVMFWVYYGIFGLLLWLYVLYLFCKYLRFYASSIPQYYGFLVIGISTMTWDIFFSPYADRIKGPFIVAGILFAKAVYEHRLNLPCEMELEARKYE